MKQCCHMYDEDQWWIGYCRLPEGHTGIHVYDVTMIQDVVVAGGVL